MSIITYQQHLYDVICIKTTTFIYYWYPSR